MREILGNAQIAQLITAEIARLARKSSCAHYGRL